MASSFEEKDRKIIPRWRPFRNASVLGELRGSGSRVFRPLLRRDFLADKLREWTTKKSIWHATDLLGAAVVLGQPKAATEAASFILEQKSGVPSSARILASEIITGSGSTGFEDPWLVDANHLQQRVQLLKRITRDEPHNSIAWMDLALNYTILGKILAAERAVRVAVALSPDNRFILRSAGRFYVHAGDAKQAFRLLEASNASRYDPWLLAAKLAIGSAASITPKSVRPAKEMLANQSVAPFNLTELASALATLELDNGKHIKARKLFQKALEAPTENTVAQVEWATEHVSGLTIRVGDFDNVPRLFEANAWEKFAKGHWNEALKQGLEWYRDQPFSIRPAQLTSYIATILEDHIEAEGIIDRGLIANPSDPTLLNNLAFAYACTGRLDGAERHLSLINHKNLNPSTQIVVRATWGLINFRRGLIEQGRNLYLGAIDMAQGSIFGRYRAKAAIHLAMEELRAKSEQSEVAFQRALVEASAIKDEDVRFLLRRLEKMHREAVAAK